MNGELLSWFALALSLGALGCGTSGPPLGTGASKSVSVGPQGGTVQLAEAQLTIPAGALSDAQTITVTSTTESAPAGTTNLSPVFRFQPEGLTFLTPATVRIAFVGDASQAAVFWSQSSGAGFDELDGTIAGGAASAQVTHFSHGFVGKHRGRDAGTDAADLAAETPDLTGAGAADLTGTTAADLMTAQDQGGSSTCVGQGQVCVTGTLCCPGTICSGAVCAACGGLGQPCCAGTFKCTSGQCCGSKCANIANDPLNCGQCGHACATTTPNCINSTCS